MKIVHTGVVVVALIGAGVLAWWWQNRVAAQAGVPPAVNGAVGKGGAGPAAPGGPVAVEVGRVEAMRLEDDTTAVGTLRSRQGVMLRPEVSGRIARLGFNDGHDERPPGVNGR